MLVGAQRWSGMSSSVDDDVRAMRVLEELLHDEREEDEYAVDEHAMFTARRGDAAADHLLEEVRRNIRSRHVRADEVDIRNILRRETRSNTRDMQWAPRWYQPPE